MLIFIGLFFVSCFVSIAGVGLWSLFIWLPRHLRLRRAARRQGV